MTAFWKTLCVSTVAVSLVGCGGDESISNQAVPTNYHNVTANLQGTVFDAVTGQRVTADNLKVVLVQGGKYRTAGNNKNYVGDYYIDNIPASTAGNYEFRIEATADGYQPVVSTYTPYVDINSLQDQKVWNLSNFYLFPVGMTAPDYSFDIMFEGEPVVGATVLMNPQINNNSLNTDTDARFYPSSGYQGALTATTDASGKVTFAGTELVLGGYYAVSVLPVVHNEVQLARYSTTYVNVGTTQVAQSITMGEIAPGSANGLYVVSASNTDSSQFTSGGALVLQLSRPVALVDETQIGASLTNANNATLDNTSTGSDVTVTVSTDGLTVTLTPNFTTAPVAFNGSNSADADNGLEVSYLNAFVRLADGSDSAFVYN
ncbi:MAG: hypothetical protein VW274_04560, partial [Thalassolituus sp.]